MTEMSAERGEWVWLRHVLVRGAGFPVELMDRLRAPRTSAALGQIRSSEAEREASRSAVLQFLSSWKAATADTSKMPPYFYKVRDAVWKRLPAPVPVPDLTLAGLVDRYNWSLREMESAWAAGEEAYEQEMRKARVELASIFAHPKLLEAVYESNPQMNGVVERYGRDVTANRVGSKLRANERSLVTYLQRFCMKNDTTSFFGPVNYGIFSNSDQPVSYEVDPASISSRKAFCAYWAVVELADRIAREPELHPYLPVRLQVGYGVTPDGQLFVPAVGRTVRLPALAAELCRRADGRTAASGLLQGRDDAREGLRLIDGLVEKGVLVRGFALPTADWDSLTTLLEQVRSIPGEIAVRNHWEAVLEEFDRLRAGYTSSSVADKHVVLEQAEQLFRDVTGKEPRRNAGEMYADRTLFYEECLGDLVRCELGSPFRQVLDADLVPILEWAARYAQIVRRACQEQARTVFRSLSPDGVPVPLAKFLPALSDQVTVPDMAPFNAAYAQLLQRKMGQGERVIRLLPEELDELLPGRLEPGLWVTSPDLLVAADPEALKNGEFTLVLGETHWGLQIFSFLLSFHPEREKAMAEARLLLATEAPQGEELVNAVVPQRAGKTFYYEFLGQSLIFGGTSTRELAETISLADLDVTDNGEELGMVKRGTDCRVLPLMGNPNSSLSWVFAPPIVVPPAVSLGEHTPRLCLGSVVYQRECWDLPAERWRSDAEARGVAPLVHVWCEKERLGMPDRVFVRVPEERKPVYIDFRVPMLVDLLQNLARRTERLQFSEMLPGSDELWLERADGRYCVEFRTSCFRQG